MCQERIARDELCMHVGLRGARRLHNTVVVQALSVFCHRTPFVQGIAEARQANGDDGARDAVPETTFASASSTLCASSRSIAPAEDELNELFAKATQAPPLLESEPLKVTILSKGAYRRFMAEKSAAGADLAHLKPPHMNASDQDIEMLLRCHEEAKQGDG